jgi:hypothetical protein
MGKPDGSRHDSGRKGRGCPGWRTMLHIHPQQHSSRWDHNQGSPRPDSPVKQLAKNSGINDPLPEQWFRKWKGVIASILALLIDVFGTMTLIGTELFPMCED